MINDDGNDDEQSKCTRDFENICSAKTPLCLVLTEKLMFSQNWPFLQTFKSV